jgi:nucleotide-binding universal stress UspA family protein
MNLKTILVNLNHEVRVPELIAAAAAIARPTEAHVVGLYVMPPLFMPSDVILPMGAEFYEEQVVEHRAQAERIKTIFDRLTHGEAYVAEWRTHGDARSAYESIADGVIEQSRSAELVIVSQAVDGKDPPMITDIPERVAMESGRPVLVIPSNWLAREYGRDVAVAWNDSREATRATFDALPLLERAKKIRLITVGETTDGEGKNTVPSADVASTLARHGLDVEIETVTNNDRHTGNALLSRVVADGSDLLVMGAYGHSRMREFILGGATRDVLKNMTVPVLMSH